MTRAQLGPGLARLSGKPRDQGRVGPFIEVEVGAGGALGLRCSSAASRAATTALGTPAARGGHFPSGERSGGLGRAGPHTEVATLQR